MSLNCDGIMAARRQQKQAAVLWRACQDRKLLYLHPMDNPFSGSFMCWLLSSTDHGPCKLSFIIREMRIIWGEGGPREAQTVSSTLLLLRHDLLQPTER